jgi:hypothetical protein
MQLAVQKLDFARKVWFEAARRAGKCSLTALHQKPAEVPAIDQSTSLDRVLIAVKDRVANLTGFEADRKR